MANELIVNEYVDDYRRGGVSGVRYTCIFSIDNKQSFKYTVEIGEAFVIGNNTKLLEVAVREGRKRMAAQLKLSCSS